MAQDKKITELTGLSAADQFDELVIVDISASETKRINASNLFASPQPIGALSASTGRFTTLQLPSGATINEFSTDGTLAGDSDVAVPTEKAVKTYVDAAIGLFSASSISDGDSSVVVADSTAGSNVTITIDSAIVSVFTSDGLTLELGSTINEFSTDGTLIGNSDIAVPTEKAVKTYVDAAIGSVSASSISDGDSSVVVTDSTASNVTTTIDSVVVSTYTSGGLTLASGATVNEFSTDGTFADNSDTAIPTEKAIKTYVNSYVPTTISSGVASVTTVDGTSSDIIQFLEETGVVATITVDGLKLNTGARINEFSTDTSLSGNSNVAVPTERAVKTYIDNRLVTINLAKIYADDSYVQVVDDGTNIGYVEVVTDGVQVAYWDASATSQRFGKSSADNGFSITTSDSSVIMSDNAGNTIASLNATTQIFGLSGDTYLTVDNSLDTVFINSATVSVMSAGATVHRFGPNTGANIYLNSSSNSFSINTGVNTQISATTTSLNLGVVGGTVATVDQSADTFTITASSTIISGDLFVDGTAWVVHNQEVTTSDNMIVINYGEVGPGVTAGFAGLEVDRGSLTNYRLIFSEDTDTFRIGEVGSTQAVATREDSPTTNVVPWWNETSKRFDTSGNTYISIDQTSGYAVVGVNSVEVLTIDGNGIQLFATGPVINEFSNDTTLSGSSATALPTENAVKTYTDAADATTLISAQVYSDAGDAATLVSANAYADAADSTTLSIANIYTDNQVDSLRTELDLINVKFISSDSTAITGDVLIVDTTASTVNIELIAESDAKIIIKKRTSGNSIVITSSVGTIDGENSITLDVENQAYTFVSDGNEYFIV